jgi:hypothetical protein
MYHAEIVRERPYKRLEDSGDSAMGKYRIARQSLFGFGIRKSNDSSTKSTDKRFYFPDDNDAINRYRYVDHVDASHLHFHFRATSFASV